MCRKYVWLLIICVVDFITCGDFELSLRTAVFQAITGKYGSIILIFPLSFYMLRWNQSMRLLSHAMRGSFDTGIRAHGAATNICM